MLLVVSVDRKLGTHRAYCFSLHWSSIHLMIRLGTSLVTSIRYSRAAGEPPSHPVLSMQPMQPVVRFSRMRTHEKVVTDASPTDCPASSLGYAPIIHQLDWCTKAHVRHAVFTHCGSPIVRASAQAVDSLVGRLGKERDIDAWIASDGDHLSLRPATRRN